jgi:hypothetical protein
MKYIKLYETFDSSAEPILEDAYNRNKVAVIAKYIKDNPAAKQAAENCKTLWKAMQGTGTDEDAIFSVFSKIKTKAELIQLMALWDLFDFNYSSGGGSGLAFFGELVSGRVDAFSKQVSNRWNIFPAMMKDVISSMNFWKKDGGTGNVEAYWKAREEFYKKNPNLRLTKLSYWLKEELNEEELAKLNGIVKKFGVKF